MRYVKYSKCGEDGNRLIEKNYLITIHIINCILFIYI